MKLFNILSNEENMTVIGVSGDRRKDFLAFSVDFIAENPVQFKTYLLATEYEYQRTSADEELDRLSNRLSDLEKQMKLHYKKSKTVLFGKYVVVKKVKGVEKTFTLDDIINQISDTMNKIMDSQAKLREKISKINEITRTAEGFDDILAIQTTTSENIITTMMRFAWLNSKCLTLKDSFVDLAESCQTYNLDKLTKKDTKESYVNMKNMFTALTQSFKITKDTKGVLCKTKTTSFGQAEMIILAETLFSSGTIGTMSATNGRKYYTLTGENKTTILVNIVKICIGKLQGVKFTSINGVDISDKVKIVKEENPAVETETEVPAEPAEVPVEEAEVAAEPAEPAK